MKEGTIFLRNKKFETPESYHPIIFWSDHDHVEFIGLMISHCTGFGNLLLNDASYFVGKSAKFRKTNLVESLLLKPVDWLVGATIIGQLSNEGIAYVKTIVRDLPLMTWDERERLRKSKYQ